MGCIEIPDMRIFWTANECLIETWDVLKFHHECPEGHVLYPFNRNMGCIEITIFCNLIICACGFNRNMGCIEMHIPVDYVYLNQV